MIYIFLGIISSLLLLIYLELKKHASPLQALMIMRVVKSFDKKRSEYQEHSLAAMLKNDKNKQEKYDKLISEIDQSIKDHTQDILKFTKL